ncbi:MAG: CinA family protein [SAR324 cluster bacterium]|nr:CinA family protein [SAR324 cluster bacterium]
MQSSLQHLSYDLRETAFFPLTGNPAGFHHLLLAELVLQQFPEIVKVVFILSNGKHPDPTKAQAIAAQNIRLQILETAIDEFAAASRSFVAKISENKNFVLRLSPKKAAVATAEFNQNQAVSLYSHVALLHQRQISKNYSAPVKMIAGEDLMQRMKNPQIFSDSDLSGLSEICQFLIAPRVNSTIADSIEGLKGERNVNIEYTEINLKLLPHELLPFLQLSSTQIRKTIQAGHALTCFLTHGASAKITEERLYLDQPASDLPNEWEQACYTLHKKLMREVQLVKSALDVQAKQGNPHTLALVESSTGGCLSAAFAALPGISGHFRESAIVYDQAAKNRLLNSVGEHSAVSGEMALKLARAFREKTGADFVLSETGMAGPMEGVRHSNKQGQCFTALLGPDHADHYFYQSSSFLSKREHQLLFATNALKHLLDRLNH